MNQHDNGLFIAAKRKEQNLTQEQLAEKLGVSNKTVSKWETGKNMPDYSVVEQLCQVLNISVGELIAGKEKEQREDNSSYEEKIALLSYKIKQLENCKTSQTEKSKTIKAGISFGAALAMVISYTQWHSIGWAILHGLMSWGYVIYYFIKY